MELIQRLYEGGIKSIDARNQAYLFKRLLPTQAPIAVDGLHALSLPFDPTVQCFLRVRGLHAALYGESLPTLVYQRSLTPGISLLYDANGQPISFQTVQHISHFILSRLSRAIRHDRCDGIDLIDGLVQYRCTWFQPPFGPDCTRWQCLWSLQMQGDEHWSVSNHGRIVPWHGLYVLDQRPIGSSVITLRAEMSREAFSLEPEMFYKRRR